MRSTILATARLVAWVWLNLVAPGLVLLLLAVGRGVRAAWRAYRRWVGRRHSAQAATPPRALDVSIIHRPLPATTPAPVSLSDLLSKKDAAS